MDRETYLDRTKSLRALRSSNLRAAWVVGRVTLLTVAGIALSIQDHLFMWILGQVALGTAIVQWFVLVHECGHRHFFVTPWMNAAAGHLASAFCLIPLWPWSDIHREHHRWVGWGDLDPTLRTTRPRVLKAHECRVVDFCWKWWIPIFTVAFGLLNFWNIPRLWQRYPSGRDRVRHVASVAFILIVHGSLMTLLGPAWTRIFGGGLCLFFLVSDPLLLSQHSHMPQHVSEGSKVTPFEPWEQDRFTRSIIFPDWISRWILLHFDAHGVHHLMPHLPCYHLGLAHERLDVRNRIDWWEWLVAAKRTPAHLLLFQDREQTGYSF